MKGKATAYLGWYGVLAILTAYVLLSFNVISSHTYTYQLLNLTGALGISVEALSKKDRQPAALNMVWAAVAVVAIVQLYAR